MASYYHYHHSRARVPPGYLRPIHDSNSTPVHEVKNWFSVSHSLGLGEALHAALGELKAVFDLLDGVTTCG